MSVERANVPVETFNAAAAQEAAALETYKAITAQQEEEEHTLNGLSCRAWFEYEVPGPHEGDIAVIEGECALPVDHDGEHTQDYSQSKAAPPAYVQAVVRYRDAARQARGAMTRWQDADDVLDQLRCNRESSSVWPCVRRRGHTGEHEHPAVMELVL